LIAKPLNNLYQPGPIWVRWPQYGPKWPTIRTVINHLVMVKHGWPGGSTVLTLGGDSGQIWLTVGTVVGNGWAKKN